MTLLTVDTQTQDLFKRPADRRHKGMEDLLEKSSEEMGTSNEVRIKSGDIMFLYDHATSSFRIQIAGLNSYPLTHFSLSQVAKMARIPISMLSRLHVKDRQDLMVDNINTLFPTEDVEDKLVLIRDFVNDEGITVHSLARAVNGAAYSRLWDYEVFNEIDKHLIPLGFSPDIPKEALIHRNNLLGGYLPALFRGDQTSFGFFFAKADPSAETQDDGLGNLHQGIMVWNSEVGARSFGYSFFYFQKDSGTILVWNPIGQKRKRFVHRGNIHKAFSEYVGTVKQAAQNMETGRINDLALFGKAAVTPFASDDIEAVQKLNKMFDIPKPQAQAIIQASYLPENSSGNVLSVWRIANGITWEATWTGRAESLVDDATIAMKVIRRLVTIKN